MTQLRRIGAILATLAVIMGAVAGITIMHPRHISHAQFGSGPVPGFFSQGTNLFQPTLTAGAAGTVTNTSGFLMQVDGGPIYCGGNQSSIAESNVVLAANTTFLLVYNCPQELVYSKVGVTGPGSSGTSASTGPGVPTSLLYAISGLEVPLATVVCNGSTCGTITDSRPASSFPSGAVQTGSVTFANLPATFPNGAALYCSNCLLASSPCSGASTGAMALRVNGAWRCQ